MSTRDGTIPVDVSVTRPSGRYIDELIRLKCGADLLLQRLFPNAKEITESFAAYRAVARFVSWASFEDPAVTLISVADGCTPRTAATFAFRTAWQCHSIDPALRDCGRWAGIERLWTHAVRVEEADLPRPSKLVIVAVHPHVHMATMLDSIPRNPAGHRALVVLPCCVPQVDRRYRAPDHDYRDPGVWSDKRRVIVWEDI